MQAPIKETFRETDHLSLLSHFSVDLSVCPLPFFTSCLCFFSLSSVPFCPLIILPVRHPACHVTLLTGDGSEAPLKTEVISVPHPLSVVLILPGLCRTFLECQNFDISCQSTPQDSGKRSCVFCQWYLCFQVTFQ